MALLSLGVIERGLLLSVALPSARSIGVRSSEHIVA